MVQLAGADLRGANLSSFSILYRIVGGATPTLQEAAELVKTFQYPL